MAIVVAVWLSRVGEAEMWPLLFPLVTTGVFSSSSSSSSSSASSSSCLGVDAISRRCRRVMRLVLPLPLGPNSRNVGVPSLPAPELLLLVAWL